jgi:hypothetical protein
MDKNELIDAIVKLEYKQFQAVQNEGGRADCQDDFETFSIMRRSQYLPWDNELVESYLQDILDAEEKPWNLVTEKYARMMQSTAPEEYEKLKNQLPQRSPERLAMQEQILKIRVRMEEDFAREYPNLHTTARVIHTSEDTAWDTSFETYCRGEIGTYSDRTVELYLAMVKRLDEEGKNLSRMTLEHMVRFYGYDSIESAEEKYQSR